MGGGSLLDTPFEGGCHSCPCSVCHPATVHLHKTTCLPAHAQFLTPAVDRVPEGADWAFSTGFIDEDKIRERLFPAGSDTICVLCGPPPMIKFACLPNLEKLGYAPEQCIQF